MQEGNQRGNLPTEHLQTLRGAALERNAEAGQVIFREGDEGDGLYVVADGLVEISAALDAHGKQVFSKLGPGEIFGEMGVVESAPRSAAATALKPTKLYFVPREAVLRLIKGDPDLAISLMRLISHRLREFNQQYLREVLQAERLSVVGRFTRAIIHDIKNPLNVIGLTAEIAGMPHATPQMRQKASADIRHQVEKMTSLVAEVLEFASGPSSGRIIPAVMSYREFMLGVLEELAPQAEQRQVTVECPAELPEVSLPLDPKRLQRAFSNLFVNALEAMPCGGRIIVRASENGREIVTEIEDTGPGVPTAIQATVFEPFITHGKVFGTGLGLSICRRIVEDHQGWVQLRSEPGKGALFVVGLPVSQSRG